MIHNRRYEKNKNYLFIDGYNIINFWEPLNKLKEISFEEARNELINILIEFSHTTSEKIILVFDAYLVKGSSEKIYSKDGIDIVFTKENESADHYIERELDRIGRLRNVRVASSDSTVQSIILSRGGSRTSARELEIEVINSKKVTENFRRKLKRDKVNSLDNNNLKKLKDFKDYLR